MTTASTQRGANRVDPGQKAVSGGDDRPLEAATHLGASARLVGRPLVLRYGFARCGLATCAEMTIDDRGLVHGSFAFGLADYAAMLAVNDANVVLGAASTRFLAPVRSGEYLVATANVHSGRGRKRVVHVDVCVGDRVVLRGVFDTFVLANHVFD